MKNHTLSILPGINKIVTAHFCNTTARICGFVKRSTSRLNGYEFVKSMILATGSDTLFTINLRCKAFNSNSEMSDQALAQRINTEAAVNLMQACFGRCLKSVYRIEKASLKPDIIKRILIQDSTCLELNKNLAEFYAGSSGAASKAAIKIDCIYDFTNEKILDIQHFSRNFNDHNNGKKIFNHLRKGDLVLRDLGYINLEELEEIDKNDSYYISRYKSNLKIYLKKEDSTPLNILEFIKKKLKHKECLDREIYLGKKKLKTRIVILKLPDEVVNERLRKAHREAQRARSTLSELKKALLSYTIFITNLSSEKYSYKDLCLLYRVRWRIELLFKEWKSQLNIKNITGKNIHRINCLIYSRLCLILLMNQFISCLSVRALELYERELSIKRALDIFFNENIRRSFFSKTIFFDDWGDQALKRLLKDKRNRKTTLEKLMERKVV
jgi:hypothetical protein